jgi:hypothetical protein
VIGGGQLHKKLKKKKKKKKEKEKEKKRKVAVKGVQPLSSQLLGLLTTSPIGRGVVSQSHRIHFFFMFRLF